LDLLAAPPAFFEVEVLRADAAPPVRVANPRLNAGSIQ
jgi:hypothetical protein